MKYHEMTGSLMNILIYTHAFAPTIGGAQKYVMLLAEGLAAKAADLQITVVTPTPADGYDDAALPFRVVRQPTMRQLWRLIAAADMVQLAGPVFLPMLFGLIQGKPTAIEHHNYQACCPNGLLLYEPTKAACPGHFMARRYHQCVRCNAVTSGWLKSFAKLLLTFPRRWMCHFATINQTVTRHVLWRLQIPRSQTIYHGIPDPLDNIPPAINPAIDQNKICFAYVGRLSSEKGLPLLVQAAHVLYKQCYSFSVRFIGDGPERTRLEQMTHEFALQDIVTFTGFLTGTAFQQELADVSVVVMPSIWEETAGLAAIEQMFRGRLVIAADIGGLGEVVGDAGLKFPMGDVEKLAACMRQVLEEPAIVYSLGQAARARALQHFRHERMVDEHLSLYINLHTIQRLQ